MKATIEVVLTTPFEYHHKGAKAEAQKLILMAPFGNVRHLTTELKQTFFRALKYHETTRGADKVNAEIPQEKDLEGKQILALMFMANVDMVAFMKTFKDLMMANKICMIDGVEQMTAVTFDKMSDEDADTVIGDYLANFIVSSLMKNLGNATTG